MRGTRDTTERRDCAGQDASFLDSVHAEEPPVFRLSPLKVAYQCLVLLGFILFIIISFLWWGRDTRQNSYIFGC